MADQLFANTGDRGVASLPNTRYCQQSIEEDTQQADRVGTLHTELEAANMQLKVLNSLKEQALQDKETIREL
jgi:hypothetical protein